MRRDPNQEADLGLADASVFVLPLWALGACQFQSGINKRVLVWVTIVYAHTYTHALIHTCALRHVTLSRALANGTSLLKVRRARNNVPEELRSLPPSSLLLLFLLLSSSFLFMPDLILGPGEMRGREARSRKATGRREKMRKKAYAAR